MRVLCVSSYEFYSPNVSSEVQRVYQALSLTDRLAPFEPCFIRRKPHNAHLPAEEVWFPGTTPSSPTQPDADSGHV